MIDTMRRTTAAVVILVLAAVVSGCSSTPEAEPASTPLIEPVAPRPDLQLTCFNVRNVRRYAALHERYVYVRVRSNEHYLLTLGQFCHSLTFATGIAISNDFSRVCSDTQAFITYQDGARTASCGIVRVEAVADREMAERVVKNRTEPKPE